MAFDPAKYRSSVLLPLSKDKAKLAILQQVIRDVQGPSGVSAAARLDMAALYCVTASMSAADLPDHLKRLESAYNGATKQPSAELLKRLLKLLQNSDQAAADPAFWAGMATARTQSLRGELDEFAQAIAQEHPLRVVTPDQIKEQATASGLDGLPQSDLAGALMKHGVEVHPDFEIPRLTVTPPLRKVTEVSEFRTIVDVVLRPVVASDVRVIDRLVWGSPPEALTTDHVRQAQVALQREQQRVEALALQHAQNALAELKSRFNTEASLHEVVLSSVALATEDLIRRGIPKVSARNELVKRGIAEIDAARLVAKLSASTPALRLNDVAEHLAAGALGEARRLLDAIPRVDANEAEWDRHDAGVTVAETKKAGFVGEYRAALQSREYVAAAEALRGALGVDREDEDLAQQLAKLPPLPPAGVSTKVDAGPVEVQWSDDGDDSVRYCVVRTLGAVPVNRADGTLLADKLEGTRFRDARPPVGRLVRYSVFATRDGVSYSDPGGAALIVLPPPVDLRPSPGSTGVALSWSTPPEAAGVVITQTSPDGDRREHRPTTPGQLSISGLSTGTRYRFSARAVYLLTGGERRESDAVEVDATPRGTIRAIDDLRIEASPTGHTATWSPVVGYSVELWAIPVAAQLPSGTRMTFAELTAQGGQRLPLHARAADAGGRSTRGFESLADVRLLVPITVDGDGGLVGPGRVAGSAPPAQMPEAEPFGDDLRLSWIWPRGDYVIEVAWAANGNRLAQRVSRAKYDNEGGFWIEGAAFVSGVTLATIVASVGQEWKSPPVKVAVSSMPPSVSYALNVRRSRLGGRGTASVVAESPQFRGQVVAITVVKEAKIMPEDATEGRVADRRTLDFSTGEPVLFDLDLGKVSFPFWVRLFPETVGGVRFDDPPTSQMRG